MAEAKEKNVSAQMTIWKKRIDGELKCAAEWEENWGFLKAPRHDAEIAGQTEAAETSDKTALEGEYSQMSAKFQYTMNRSKTPKEKYARPITTQQELGWRPSLELFGNSKHGIRRSPDLWPDR